MGWWAVELCGREAGNQKRIPPLPHIQYTETLYLTHLGPLWSSMEMTLFHISEDDQSNQLTFQCCISLAGEKEAKLPSFLPRMQTQTQMQHRETICKIFWRRNEALQSLQKCSLYTFYMLTTLSIVCFCSFHQNVCEDEEGRNLPTKGKPIPNTVHYEIWNTLN